jgi:hypothetical protein
MSKFKEGDRVRYIVEGDNILFGEEGVVEMVRYYEGSTSLTVRFPSKDRPWGLGAEEVELVAAAESELERLVRVANEGTVASKEIDAKYANQVEEITEETDKSVFISYRIKPIFEPFNVGPGVSGKLGESKWRVKLEGDRLHIGCRNFPVSWLKNALTALCRNPNTNSCTIGTHTIVASRGGVSSVGETISWEAADKILAALEKAGVK